MLPVIDGKQGSLCLNGRGHVRHKPSSDVP